MNYQDLFSLKTKINLECRLLQILLGALRVKSGYVYFSDCECHEHDNAVVSILASAGLIPTWVRNFRVPNMLH